MGIFILVGVAQAFDDIVSAGFCQLDTVQTWGKSESLNEFGRTDRFLPRPEDAGIIVRDFDSHSPDDEVLSDAGDELLREVLSKDDDQLAS